MKKAAAFLLVGALLMGCDSEGNPFTTSTTPATPGAPAPGPATGIPAGIAGDVDSITFDPTTNTLSVTGLTLDNVPVTTVYTRTPSLDKDGFLAYTSQNDPLDRHFTALAAQGTTVRAASAGSPLPRNRTFRGAFFERDGGYTPPTVTGTTGLVSYVGDYAGVTNGGDPNPQNLLSTTITDPELQPFQALLVDGDVFLNADFADGSVEGNIINRRLIRSDGVTTDLPSLVLIASDVDTNGNFSGTVEYDILDPLGATGGALTQVGTYAGLFGGPNASEVAGAVDLTEFDGVGDAVLGAETEEESGAFVLQSCAVAAPNPICAQIP
ncbi:MAG: hypothetical protein AAF280_06530 [Pseudomonadota bacterium]